MHKYCFLWFLDLQHGLIISKILLLRASFLPQAFSFSWSIQKRPSGNSFCKTGCKHFKMSKQLISRYLVLALCCFPFSFHFLECWSIRNNLKKMPCQNKTKKEIFYFENEVIKSWRISKPERLSVLNIGVILQAAEADLSISKTSSEMNWIQLPQSCIFWWLHCPSKLYKFLLLPVKNPGICSCSGAVLL